MKKLFIMAGFMLVLLGTAFCVGKAAGGQETAEASGREQRALSLGADHEQGGVEQLSVFKDKPMALETVLLLGRNREAAEEKERRAGMAGRLLVPSAGIDVALFIDGPGADEAEKRQNICDLEDGAALFSDGYGDLIADHNNQAFSLLGNVQPGDRAYILRGHSILTLECSLVMKGHNYGEGVVDEDGLLVSSYTDYICYTCEDNWNNVGIAGFSVVDEDYVI